MLKIEDVKVGDELICIFPEFFKDKSLNKNAMNYLNESMKVLVVDESIILTNDENFYLTVFPNELKHFKKKEQPTFNDLIDVAVQAVKDGLIACDDFKCHSISFCVAWDEDDGYELASHHDAKYFNEAIDFIQSLYKETFVIECEDDLNKIKREVGSIVLSNGEDIIDDVKFSENKPYFTNGGVSWVRVPFSVLKGATVEQERGRDDRS